LDPNTGKWYGKYENYRVLIGLQHKIDICKKEIEDKVKGSFEIHEQMYQRDEVPESRSRLD
jgi:hypothetical protein